MQEGHFGNPFIFEDIIEYLQNGKQAQKRSKKEILETILKHIELELEEKGEYTGIREMRKHISWYTKGMENSSVIRNYINQIENKEELIKALTEYFNQTANI